jgi:hypothetical protein
MRMTLPYTLLALTVLGGAGCGGGGTGEAGANAQAPVADELTAIVGGSAAANPCRLVTGASLPLDPAEIVVVGTGPYDMVGTVLVGDRGEVSVVYESYADDWLTSSQLDLATSSDCGRTFTAPQPLALGPAATYRTTPSAVKLGSHRYLFFTAADDFEMAPTIWRSELREGRFGAAEAVGPISGVDSLLSWPRFTEGPLGLGVAVAFRTIPQKGSRLDWSLDGFVYAELPVVDPGPTAMPRAAFFGNGTAVFAYQVYTESSDDWSLRSWWRLSTISGGHLAWTDPVLVTNNSVNVNDTAPFLRSDGDIDLYYVYSSQEPTDTFKLYRRCLTRRGVLGPEQQLTTTGSPNKPNLARLPGGKVLLLFADITRVDEYGYPLEQVLKAAVLAGDAPRN